MFLYGGSEVKVFKIMAGKIFRPRVIIPLILFLLLIGGGIYFWLQQSFPVEEEAERFLQSDEKVEVSEVNDIIKFSPRGEDKSTHGIIFYPGGQVQARSYAVLAYKLSEAGYSVFLVDMPFQLAILNWSAGSEIIKEHGDIKGWSLAGHSLGGAMAARLLSREQPQAVENIIFLAAYPAEEDDISTKNVNSITIYGGEDGILDKERLKEREDLLPAGYEIAKIEGGNHAGFAHYGEQGGDGEADMTGLEQIEMTAAKILEFMSQEE